MYVYKVSDIDPYLIGGGDNLSLDIQNCSKDITICVVF